MQVIENLKVKEKLYIDKLENGLTVMIIPKKGIEKKYIIWGTNYGSNDSKFIVPGETETIEVPKGVAHFLEHKLFEQENGTNSLDTLTALGVNANAYTTNDHTAYLYECTDNFYEALDEFMDYVQHPYFTDENVEKEKGIIGQEIMMYDDYPEWRVYLNAMEAMYHNNPIKIDITGTIETISHIDKEILYKCYNTFYNPGNMCLIIVTNEEEEKVINFVKEIEEKRKVDIETDIEVKKINEPENVNKEFDIIYQNVSKCELSYSFKLPINDYKIPYHKLDLYLYIIFISNLGKLTGFGLDLKEKNLINGNIGIGTNKYMDYIVPSINVSTDYPEKIINILDKKIKEFSLNEEYFNMIKKSMISDFVYCFTGVSNVMSYLFGSYANNKKILTTDFKDFQELNFEELKEVFNKLNLDNKSILIMKPLEEKE